MEDKAIKAAFNKIKYILDDKVLNFTDSVLFLNGQLTIDDLEKAIQAYEAAKAEITKYHIEDFYESGGKIIPYVNQWQPIETAPKDGTKILVYGYYIYDGDKDRTEYTHLVVWDEDFSAWESDDGEFVDSEIFSHWQPLPSPPHDKDASNEKEF